MAVSPTRHFTPWHLLGAGSLGCLYAAYLRQANCDIRLLLRDTSALEQFHAAGGIHLQRDNEWRIIDIAAEIATAVHEPIRHLLVCTKAQQTPAAIHAIKFRLVSQPIIVLLQNGMGVRELLQQEIPDAIFLHAISTEGAYQTQRFHVVHAGRGNAVLGAVQSSEFSIAQDILDSLRSELRIDAADDIQQRLWLKLAVNSVINPLTTLHQCRNGELLQLPKIDSTIEELCAELVAVANADGENLTLEQCRAAVFDVINATAMNRSSMLQDRLANRPTEIDFINGFIVQRAENHGIPCPLHAELWSAIKALEP